MTATPSGPGLVEELAALLRERLYDGRYVGGSVLSQAGTAAELGVSRTPLREVFRILAAEGLVRPDPAGAIVIGMDLARWHSAVPLRSAVDVVAAELCARGVAAGRGLSELRTVDPTVRTGRVGIGEQDFHLALLRASDNEFVREQGALVRRTTVLAGPLWPTDPSMATRCTADHRAVLDAVLAGEPVLAAQRAAEHQSHLAAALARPR